MSYHLLLGIFFLEQELFLQCNLITCLIRHALLKKNQNENEGLRATVISAKKIWISRSSKVHFTSFFQLLLQWPGQKKGFPSLLLHTIAADVPCHLTGNALPVY
jgi:hypothetical protein